MTLTRGREDIHVYNPSTFVPRAFCRVCGAPAPHPAPTGPLTGVSMGTLDDAAVRRAAAGHEAPITPALAPEIPRPTLHKAVAAKARWDEIGDALPQFPGDDPPSGAPA